MKTQTILILTTILLLTGCTAYQDAQKNAGDIEWLCSAYTCSDEQTGTEWANENCEVTEQGTVCPVTVDGQQEMIPLQQLNLTNVNVCQEYTCIEETPSRTTNYTTETVPNTAREVPPEYKRGQ